jgi:hypothetical protein
MYTLKVYSNTTLESQTTIDKPTRGEALKVVTHLKHIYGLRCYTLKLTKQTEQERAEIERRFNELENY